MVQPCTLPRNALRTSAQTQSVNFDQFRPQDAFSTHHGLASRAKSSANTTPPRPYELLGHDPCRFIPQIASKGSIEARDKSLKHKQSPASSIPSNTHDTTAPAGTSPRTSSPRSGTARGAADPYPHCQGHRWAARSPARSACCSGAPRGERLSGARRALERAIPPATPPRPSPLRTGTHAAERHTEQDNTCRSKSGSRRQLGVNKHKRLTLPGPREGVRKETLDRTPVTLSHPPRILQNAWTRASTHLLMTGIPHRF